MKTIKKKIPPVKGVASDDENILCFEYLLSKSIFHFFEKKLIKKIKIIKIIVSVIININYFISFCALFKSPKTISLTKSLKEYFGLNFNSLKAFLGSPFR